MLADRLPAQSACMGASGSNSNSSLRPDPDGELSSLFDRYRSRLRLMVDLRMDRRVQARVDASDVLQEAYLDAAGRYERYRAEPGMPPFLWLRFLVGQQLLLMHRSMAPTEQTMPLAFMGAHRSLR